MIASHLIGIMISKTIGFRGTLFSDKPIWGHTFDPLQVVAGSGSQLKPLQTVLCIWLGSSLTCAKHNLQSAPVISNNIDHSDKYWDKYSIISQFWGSNQSQWFLRLDPQAFITIFPNLFPIFSQYFPQAFITFPQSFPHSFRSLFEARPGLLLEVVMCTALHPGMGSGPGLDSVDCQWILMGY